MFVAAISSTTFAWNPSAARYSSESQSFDTKSSCGNSQSAPQPTAAVSLRPEHDVRLFTNRVEVPSHMLCHKNHCLQQVLLHSIDYDTICNSHPLATGSRYNICATVQPGFHSAPHRCSLHVLLPRPLCYRCRRRNVWPRSLRSAVGANLIQHFCPIHNYRISDSCAFKRAHLPSPTLHSLPRLGRQVCGLLQASQGFPLGRCRLRFPDRRWTDRSRSRA